MRESNKISFIQSEKDKNVEEYNAELINDEVEDKEEEYNIIYLKKEISPTNLAPINEPRCFSNKEKEINIKLGPFRNHKNIKFSNNIFSDLMELDENEDNSIIQRIFSIDIDKLKLPNNSMKFDLNNLREVKTDNLINKKCGRQNEQNEKIPEINSIEIAKVFRKDNDRIKIKKIIFKSFLEKINEKIKDVNLKIKEFEQKKIKDISRANNYSLFNNKWKDIILENSIGNSDIIKNIYENNEKDIIELLEMTFGQYFDIFINNNWEQFIERERESQMKKYKQKKYKEIINEIISDKNVQNLERIKKYTTIGVKNKKGENILDSENKEENIIEKFERHNYKIIKEKEFIVFIHSLNQYKNISFEISLKELEDINKHISILKVLVNDFKNWIEKKPRNIIKKITKKFSVKKFKK